MSCVKDSHYMANSVNNGQNALDGMIWSGVVLDCIDSWSLQPYLLYAQDNCHLFCYLSNVEFKGSDDMANG